MEVRILGPLEVQGESGPLLVRDDQNDCDTVVVENGEWVAGANTFTNTETGDVVEGVNVTRLDDNEKIVAHYAHLEAPAE